MSEPKYPRPAYWVQRKYDKDLYIRIVKVLGVHRNWAGGLTATIVHNGETGIADVKNLYSSKAAALKAFSERLPELFSSAPVSRPPQANVAGKTEAGAEKLQPTTTT